ncbi:MAG: right-handed parallel beta-helix repeat-containing protein [Prevotella sp.]|nr:right-handed parallel beta-helix repeat-containing protein [Prevotella sp.]
MKRLSLLILLLTACFFSVAEARPADGQKVIEVAKYGAKGNGKLCTKALNKAIQKAPEGAIVHIPAGKYLTGTIHLKSHITLQIDEQAEIIGVSDLDAYDHYLPTKDMTRYDTGAGGANANLTGDERWTKALILGQNLVDVIITGKGTINGQHVEDSLGEESMRGPHGILIAESSNIRIENLNIHCASNYAVLCYELKNSKVDGLTICEGWDGVHIRGCENVTISNCDIKTGDDCIAGGYWNGMTITDCKLNSSCNGIRMIEPSTNLTIQNCYIYGPGTYPHRTSRAQQRKKSLYGIVLEPGAWGDAPGHTENVVIRNVTMDNLLSPLVYSMGANNTCSGLYVDGLTATHITYNTTPLNRQDCVRMWDNINFKNYVVKMGE